MKKIFHLFLLLQLFLGCAFAQQGFVVNKIEIQGLQRIAPSTVQSYLPIKRGQTLRPQQTSDILRALYKTGFFDHITLSREGSTLIIHVTERPTIGELKITGNSVIPTDKLTSVMKTLDVAEGRVYNPAVLEKIKQSLLNQYYQLGRYNARVDISATPMTRNRVLVKIDISEGLVAKIRRISIIGNHVFDEATLLKQLDMSPSGMFSFISQSDRYSEEKLEASLDKLRGYYMDRGYLHFEIKSSQAEVTPDRKSVYVTIVIVEGEPYTISGYEVQGNMVVPRAELLKQIHIKPGEAFSRQKVLDAEKGMTKLMGDQGYLFATVSIMPRTNDQTHQVYLTFTVKPGKRAYVRHVTFSDNARTNDIVLRREIEQMEAAPASSTKIENSKHNLLMLPYIKEADISVRPVPEIDDQVDINYKVKEDSSAQASFKVGYSQVYRVLLGAGLNQKNFFGTGNTLGINFQHSKYEQVYAIDYTNPYYTEDGISRTFNLSVSHVDPGGAGIDTGYTNDEYDAGVSYGIPIGQEEGAVNRILAGAGYQNTLVKLNNKMRYVSNQVSSFIQEHGRRFQELDLKLGYYRDSRDKAFMPTSGMMQTFFIDGYAPLDHNSLTFYALNYSGRWYQPLNDKFIIMTRADLGYGTGLHNSRDYPFFKNFYAGGIESVRGYQGYTLGPRDSKGKPLGANMLVDASISLIFPNYISDNLRTSIFVDAGNVYSSFSNHAFGGFSSNAGPVRYSTGIEADLLTPFGPLKLSVSQPLNRRVHDERETFQFALGANF